MNNCSPRVVSSTGEESEEGVSWMLQTAHLFLSSINAGIPEDGEDVHQQVVPDYELDSEHHQLSEGDAFLLTRKPSEIGLRTKSKLDPQWMIIDGRQWRPTVMSDPVAFLASQRKTALAVVSFIGFRDESRRRRRHISMMEATTSFLCPIPRPTKAQSYAHLLIDSR